MPSHERIDGYLKIGLFGKLRSLFSHGIMEFCNPYFSLILLITFCYPSIAKNFYVNSKQSNDSLDGFTPETAWKTTKNLKRAKIQPGDSILFSRGGKWENEQIEFHKGGHARAPVIIGQYGQKNLPKPHIVDSGAHTIALSASHLVVSGLRISGARRYGIATKGRNLRNLEILDSEIHDCTNGILINEVNQAIIADNIIHSIYFRRSNSGAIGITLDRSSDIKITNNKFRNCIGRHDNKHDGGAIELFRSNHDIQITNNQAINTWGFIEMGGLSGDTIRNITISANTAINTRSFAWFNLDTPTDTSNFWGIGYDSILLTNNTLIQNRAHTSNAIGSNGYLTDSNQIAIRNNIFSGDSLHNFVYKGNFNLFNNVFWSKTRQPKYALPPTNRLINPQIVVDTNSLTYFAHPNHLKAGVGSPQSGTRN